jgi:hypothetical protein
VNGGKDTLLNLNTQWHKTTIVLTKENEWNNFSQYETD